MTTHLDPTSLPERLEFVPEGDIDRLRRRIHQGESDAWVLLMSLRPLHAHEDEAVRELARSACANLIALLRALRRAREKLGGEG